MFHQRLCKWGRPTGKEYYLRLILCGVGWLAWCFSISECGGLAETPTSIEKETATPTTKSEYGIEKEAVVSSSPDQESIQSIRRAVVRVTVNFKDREKKEKEEHGSGFLVSRDGFVLTAAHVLRGVNEDSHAKISVWFDDDRTAYSATFVDVDDGTELGLLRISGKAPLKKHTPLRLATDAGFLDGTTLVTYGFLAGENKATFQEGKVGKSETQLFVYSASIKPGYSGGPICLPEADVVVGINLGEKAAGHAQGRKVNLVKKFLDHANVQTELVTIGRGAAEGESASGCRTPFYLPPRLSNFVGRENELKTIMSALSNGEAVSVSGIGGSGKTALANEALWRMWEQGKTNKGVIWVQVGSRPLDIIVKELARQACRSDIEHSGQDPEVLLVELRRYLQLTRTIVVLDDVRSQKDKEPRGYTNANSEPVASSLLCGLEGTTYVQTGRSKHNLSCMAKTKSVQLEGLTREASKMLFINESGLDDLPEVRRSIVLDQICELLSDHPLAVSIGARRYKELPQKLPDFVHELRKAGIRGLRVGEGIYEDLQRNFAQSVNLLTLRQLQYYQALGIFPEGSSYSWEAVKAVADATGEVDFGNDIRKVKRLGLVEWDAIRHLFKQHDLLHRDAEQRLLDSYKKGVTTERYITYYEAIAVTIENTDESRWDIKFENEKVHLFVAIEEVLKRYKQSNDRPDAKRLVKWANYLNDYGWKRQIRQAEIWLVGGYEAAKVLGDIKAQSVLALSICNLIENFGRSKDVIDWGIKAFNASKIIHDHQAENAALGSIGLAYFQLGDIVKAIGYYNDALSISREIQDMLNESIHLNRLGLAYFHLGEIPKSIGYYNDALSISREIKDKREEVTSLDNLGDAYSASGEIQKAINFHQQALIISREIGDRRGEVASLDNLGSAYSSFGETKKTIDYHRQALAISQKIGDRRGEAANLGNLGLVYSQLGEFQKAIDHYSQAISISHEIDDRLNEGNLLGNLGLAYSQLGEFQKAIGYYNRAISITHEFDDRLNEGLLLGNLGLAYSQLGEFPKAIKSYNEAISVSREVDDKPNLVRSLGNIGLAYFQLGEVQKSIDYYNESIAISRAIDDGVNEGNLWGNLGLSYSQLGEFPKAIECYQQALVIAQDIRDKNGEGLVLCKIGTAYNNLGDIQQAHKYWQDAIAIFDAIKSPTANIVKQWMNKFPLTDKEK